MSYTSEWDATLCNQVWKVHSKRLHVGHMNSPLTRCTLTLQVCVKRLAPQWPLVGRPFSHYILRYWASNMFMCAPINLLLFLVTRTRPSTTTTHPNVQWMYKLILGLLDISNVSKLYIEISKNDHTEESLGMGTKYLSGRWNISSILTWTWLFFQWRLREFHLKPK